LYLLALIGCFGSAVGALPLLVAGYGEQREADNEYVVDYRRPHEHCGESQLTIDLDTGRPLYCEPMGIHPFDRGADLAGFTDAQNEQVVELSVKLSPDGLTAGERDQIQALVDKFVATVPAAERADRHPGLYGARLVWLGGGLLAIAALLYFFVIRTPRSARPVKPQPPPRPPRGKHV
jgi:hypothetical protein